MKEQWRQQMQQKMADYKRPAPEVSWDELDKALACNKQKAIDRQAQFRNEAKTVPMWTRRIAAAVVALVVMTAGYLAFHQQEPPKQTAVAVSKKAETIVTHKTAEPQQANEEPATLIADNTKPHLLAYSQEKASQEDRPSISTPQEEQASEPQEQAPISQPQETQVQETHESQNVIQAPKRQTLDYPSEVRQQKVSEKHLMAQVYLSNGLAGGNFPAGDYDNPVMIDFSNKNGTDYVKEQTEPMIHEEDVFHHQPIRFGLSLRYRLNDKWSLESGLAYTRLRSYFKRNTNGVRVNTEQTLSYIGIPLSANYLLSSSRYINFYVSAGGMVEKMVRGRLHHESGSQKQLSTESVSIRPLQFSVSGGIGAEFNLSRQFSIYAEPGIGYYFDNGSSVPTYYQDTPLILNLNLGLRFNIK